MTELERAADMLTQAGWIVQRPPFDDPYEVLFRQMLRVGAGPGEVHPDDDPTNPAYQWGEWDERSLRFLKDHFIIRAAQGTEAATAAETA